MHMGSLSTIGNVLPKNFCHILINNFAHESVGGQETAANFINTTKIAKANGYNVCSPIDDLNTLRKQFINYLNCDGPAFLEIKTKIGSREDLGRPTIKPVDNKLSFMDYLDD